MTVDEYEQQYAERNGVTVEELHARGMRGGVCECGGRSCDGFQMFYRDVDAALAAELLEKWAKP